MNLVALHFQVEGRDEEIERLSRMLDGGRSSDVVALEARNRANERMISHLNIQVMIHFFRCCGPGGQEKGDSETDLPSQYAGNYTDNWMLEGG